MTYRLEADFMGGGMDGTSYITDRNGNPNVFNFNRNDDGLWLNNNWADPGNRWNADNEFVFRLRKYFFFSAVSKRAVFLFGIFETPFSTTKHFPCFFKF